MANSGSCHHINFDNLCVTLSCLIVIQDDYLFLYRAMESLVANMSLNESADGNSPYGSQLTVTNNLNSNGHTLNGHAVKIVIPGDIIKTESFA